ncbi:MAG: pirin family protein [Vampirovibrionales bacterium]
MVSPMLVSSPEVISNLPDGWYYRPSDTRGCTRLSWLESKHTFSFGDYIDPQWHHVSGLRVINEDTVAPAQGFGWHGHQHMEIITYVRQGMLQHEDSLGNKGILQAGDWQYMHVGSGIQHKEWNPSTTTPSYFMQLWLKPYQKDAHATPHYQDQLPVQTWLETASIHLSAVLTGAFVDPTIARPATLMHHQGGVGLLNVTKPEAMQPVALAPIHTVISNTLASLEVPPTMVWLQVLEGNMTLQESVLQEGQQSTLPILSLQAGDGVGIPLEAFKKLSAHFLQDAMHCECLWFALS